MSTDIKFVALGFILLTVQLWSDLAGHPGVGDDVVRVGWGMMWFGLTLLFVRGVMHVSRKLK